MKSNREGFLAMEEDKPFPAELYVIYLSFFQNFKGNGC